MSQNEPWASLAQVISPQCVVSASRELSHIDPKGVNLKLVKMYLYFMRVNIFETVCRRLPDNAQIAPMFNVLYFFM